MLGVGRGRKVAVVLAYQNLGQVYAHYGRDGGDAVLGSINTIVFLPGLDQRTTEFAASRLGRTTVLQHTTVDAVGTQNDAERLAETRRDLMDAAELRQLVRYKQAVAIIDTAPPIKFSYPPLIQAAPNVLSQPIDKGTPHIRTFKEAETQDNDLAAESPLEPADTRPNAGKPTNRAKQPRTSVTNQVAPGRAEDGSSDSAFEQQSMKG